MAALKVTLNGQVREFEGLQAGVTLEALIAAMELKADRVAVEWNGEIVPRARWGETKIKDGDKVEVVHFVGGGR